jgi:hypothetical protein
MTLPITRYEPQVLEAIARNMMRGRAPPAETLQKEHELRMYAFWDEQEAILGRMLAHWISGLDIAPVLYFDHRGEIIGLGPVSEIGAIPRILVHAADHRR